MADIELADLLARCRAGDELAWEAFVRRFQGRVYSIAFAYAGQADDARELAQDIFVRLFETRRKWADAPIFLPWLIRTSRNLSVDYLRRRGARTKATETDIDDAAELTGAGLDPESQAIAGRRRSLVWRALRRLTTINREVLVLREMQGLSLEDVAGMLRIPIGTVKSRSNRARLELAQHVLSLEQAAGPEPPR
jgi:RNA polymerase sigma-70 factor (ECF subfamily)